MKNSAVHIIGSGITGLGAAYFLRKMKVPSIVFEDDNTVGGRAGFREKNNTILEIGGKNFNSGWELFNQILDDLNIKDYDAQHTNFPLIIHDKVYIIDKRYKIKTAFDLLRSIGIKGLLHFLRFTSFVAKNRHLLNYEQGLIEEIEKKYDADPITHWFPLSLAYGPFRLFSIIMSGAEPEETYYSNLVLSLAAQSGTSHSIQGGSKILFERLCQGQDVRLNTRVNRIIIKDNQVVRLSVSQNQKEFQIPARRIISAVPSYALKNLISFPPGIIHEIDKIRYFPVIIILAKYKKDIFNDRLKSIFFDNSHYVAHCSANRTHQKDLVRYSIAGKKGRSLLDMNDEELISLAESELSKVLPISAERLYCHVHRHEKGICAYCPNFTKVRKQILSHASTIKGLEIAGDYLNGHHLEGCLESAKNAVENLW